jgi:hypothetical protein
MKNMRKLFALAAALVLVASTTFAADYGVYKFSSPASGALSAVSTDVGLYVRYVGTTAGKPTVEVDAATGDITFKIAGSVDTTVGCPTVGTGIIDVSDAACDTFSEVINKVIGQSSNWQLVPGAVLGSDSTNNTLGTQAATDTNIRTSGVALLKDTAVTFQVGVQLIPPGYTQSTFGSFWFQGQSNRVNSDPFANVLTALGSFRAVSTYGSGTSTLKVYAVKSTFSGVPGSMSYTEVVRTLWSETGGNTTVENQTDFVNFPLLALGERIIFRVENSAALTAPDIVAGGAIYHP